MRTRLAFVFAATFAFLWWMLGHWVAFNMDEGIYLDGGVRVLHGSLPYRDFFAVSGPGTFFNVAILFELFGVKLSAARLLLVGDLSLIAACLYWLAAQFLPSAAAAWLTSLYVALLFVNPGNLAVNHRWDSAACAALAACCCYQARQGHQRVALAAGVAGAYAAWITPPAILFLPAMLGWLLFERALKSARFLSLGGALAFGAGLLYFLFTHSLRAGFDQMIWNTARYAVVNRVFYGDVVGGYRAQFQGLHGVDLAVRCALLAFVALPAIALPLGLMRARRGAFVALMTIAALLACYPKMDLAHLQFAAHFSYLLAAVALPPTARKWLAWGVTFGALIFVFTAIDQRIHFQSIETRVGVLSGTPEEIAAVRWLETGVQPGEGFFAFPYMPLAYFLTRGKNPTRYSYLAPGMMTASDEAAALKELQTAPPAKVLYAKLEPQAYLRVFPSARPGALRMARIDAWLRRHYQPFSASGSNELLLENASQPYTESSAHLRH